MAKEECAMIRKYLIQMISSVFQGDELVAEYMLLSMLSRVYADYVIFLTLRYKRAMNLALGTFSLNITNCPEKSSTFHRQVDQMIKAILPKSYWLPMSTDFLNNNRFIPKKDYDTNRLHSGILQLSEGTFLIIDETSLESGLLESTGIHDSFHLIFLRNSKLTSTK